MIRDGFYVCGQHVESKINGGPTVSFEKIIWQCYSDISEDQMELMERKTDHFATLLEREGNISYDSLLEQGIRPDTISIDRTSLTYVRHWSEIVNHKFTIERYRMEQSSRSPEIIERGRQEKEDRQKIIARTTNKENESTAHQLNKDKALIARHTEKERFNALSKQEQQQERAAKAAAAKEKKQLQQETEQKAVQAALTRLQERGIVLP